MIKFLLTGILRDRSRSLLPIIIVSIGAFLTVFLSAWINGMMGDIVRLNANHTTGHVKIMTKAYEENASQKPNDLALLDVAALTDKLNKDYPDMEWTSRIQFGGLIDVGDENGETKAQGPAVGFAVDLFSKNTKEIERMEIKNSIRKGKMPQNPSEALISDEFADQLKVKPGDEVTLFGSTMDGSMAFKNFKITGTVHYGVAVLDRGAIIVDLSDAQLALAMDDAAGELLGYFKDGEYDVNAAAEMAVAFNTKYADDKDEFAPVMKTLREQNGLASMIDQGNAASWIFSFIFIFAMSIVLWNTGLLGGLRRYGEFGVRLAMGEEKGHIYRTIIYESAIIGLIGSLIGTVLGIMLGYFIQQNGINLGFDLKNSSMMMPTTMYTKVTAECFYIGFIPGLFSMVLGYALSGIGIFKRQTAQLFKELEV